eukprot:CAMPEP_0172515158 /NCGR_PEP_ID=MMETSP1066-20121228/265858_1 /TAXON_ID=671091 /ORGANISM="Coscinodiscus wailesii, Strain CCMP2513" /LENGTH=188 /DNA_ID=CAMNT_0013296129 /DNA_START=69 /DNA_END=632 /DNA_ORIENTATION=+
MTATTARADPKHQKHRRVLSAVEGSAAQSFLVSALDTLSSDCAAMSIPPMLKKEDASTPVAATGGGSSSTATTPTTTFSQWNNAALSKAAWDNGDTDGLLLPITDGFDGSSSVAATAAASTCSQRSILSNSSDELEPEGHDAADANELLDVMQEEDQTPMNGEKTEVKRVRVQQQLLHQRRLQNAQAR